MALNPVDVKYFKMANSNVLGNSEDLYCKCHICGDSKKNPNKKRLHLYTKPSFSGSVVHCWNCGYSSSSYNYFKTYFPELFSSYKNEVNLDNLNSLKKKEEIDLSDLEDDRKEDVSEELLTLEEFNKLTKPLSSNSLEYLKRRELVDFIDTLNIRECKEELSLFGKTIFGENSIVIPFLTKDNKVFGFQTRSTVDKKFFIVLNSNFEGHKIWNLDLVDKSKTIYAFESIFDAVSSGLDNIIALLGIHNYKNLDKNLDVVYCLDNQKVDQTSLEISKEIAKKNLKLFVWTTDKVKDFNELLVKVKDRNKIANYIKNNIYNGLDAYIRL